MELVLASDELHNAAVTAVAAAVEDLLEDEPEENQWSGSSPGKSPDKKRDFKGAYKRLVCQYFSGDESVYNEKDFEQRFRMPRHVFNRICLKLHGMEPFVQKHDAITKEPGIVPLVRCVACLRKLSYGDPSDRGDE